VNPPRPARHASASSVIYHDLDALWRDTIAKNPACWLAYNNLGNVLAAQGHLDDAVEHYAEAVRLNPNYAEARSNLARTLAARKSSR
jgi:cytochrome c-type biogenesis protein CcmH/NrfG